ncbi:hypothetical protein CDL12_19256 [Handroanthus impetiginosus]|uniref:RNase H type-1 domain-containing protein n=1 Tax=Handroanthus impetiginosus TaxID=429701 RepID=A0A2G9GSA5_9LAMI|nr:hypothetical protein CDL12_19256 [Handroanthus impetiginosus]
MSFCVTGHYCIGEICLFLGFTNPSPMDANFVRQYLDDFGTASACLNNSTSNSSDFRFWFSPDAGHVKVIYDATCLNNPKETFVGHTASDSHGLFIACCVIFNKPPLELESAEAWVVKSTYMFALEFQWPFATMEGDYLQVVKAINPR